MAELRPLPPPRPPPPSHGFISNLASCLVYIISRDERDDRGAQIASKWRGGCRAGGMSEIVGFSCFICFVMHWPEGRAHLQYGLKGEQER